MCVSLSFHAFLCHTGAIMGPILNKHLEADVDMVRLEHYKGMPAVPNDLLALY